MSLLFGTLQLLATADIPNGPGSNGYVAPGQEQSVVVNLGLGQARERCVEVLSTIHAELVDGGSAVSTDQNRGDNKTKVAGQGLSFAVVVRGRTSMSWRSFGEHIVIGLTEHTAPTNASGHQRPETLVAVSSAPVVSTTLVDYGKGLENVGQIIARIADGVELTTLDPEQDFLRASRITNAHR